MIKSLTILCVLLAASTAQAHWNYRYDFTSTYIPYYAPVYQSYYYPAYRPYYAADLSTLLQSIPVSAGMVRSCRKAMTRFSRHWAMPNSDTFAVKPIGDFVQRYLVGSETSVDPFARNSTWATYTNDINFQTHAQRHMDAEMFLGQLADEGVIVDLAILDPPYSPRQISECYKDAKVSCVQADTQNAKLYSRVRTALIPILQKGATVLSFGWNSVGMGKKHGFEIMEIMLCSHGAVHNDTICLAERHVILE